MVTACPSCGSENRESDWGAVLWGMQELGMTPLTMRILVSAAARHGVGAAARTDRVIARAPAHRVSAAATAQPVVARAAVDAVRA